jgi:hypothetical protein
MKNVRVAVPVQLWAMPQVEEDVETRRVPSLADLARLEHNSHILVPWTIDHKRMAAIEASSAKETIMVMCDNSKAGAADEGIDDEGMGTRKPTPAASDERLAALSAELAKLRELIAVVVTKQDSFVPAPAAFAGAPPPPPLPNFMSGAPPPPPPPPPSAASLMDHKKIDMTALIKQNRKGQENPGTIKKGPSMADVLAGLGSVKLKSTKNTDGTVTDNAAQAANDGPMDAASMIAAALKRKFAHKQNSSPGGEAAQWAAREKAMKERKQAERDAQKPQFGLHLLRKANRKPLASVQVAGTSC